MVSLIYVGVQVSDNSAAARSATANNALNSMMSWYLATGTSSEAVRVYRKAMNDPASLNGDENFQFIFLIHAIFLSFQNSFYLEQEGTLDETVRNSITASLMAVKDQPGFIHYWEQRKEIFTKDFRDYVEHLRTVPANKASVLYTQQPDGTGMENEELQQSGPENPDMPDSRP